MEWEILETCEACEVQLTSNGERALCPKCRRESRYVYEGCDSTRAIDPVKAKLINII